MLAIPFLLLFVFVIFSRFLLHVHARVVFAYSGVDHKLKLLGNFLILGNSGKSLPLKILLLMRHTR